MSRLVTFLSLLLVMSIQTVKAQNSFSIKKYKGQLVYLDFWASWCGPCRQSFPWMIEMNQKYKNSGLTIVAVNLDEESQLRDNFLKDFDIKFETLSDPKGLLAEHYELLGMPYTILFDKNGNIVERHHGFVKSKTETYENEIKNYLKMEKQ